MRLHLVFDSWGKSLASGAVLLLAVSISSGCGDTKSVAEAKQFSQEYIAQRFKDCGEVRVTKTRLYEVFGEVRDLSWSVERGPITDTDRLNGIEFKGKILLDYSAARWSKDEDLLTGPPCWHPWGEKELPKELSLVKQRGVWGVSGHHLFNHNDDLVPECQDVPELQACS